VRHESHTPFNNNNTHNPHNNIHHNKYNNILHCNNNIPHNNKLSKKVEKLKKEKQGRCTTPLLL
jgi:hypothetical protein